MAAYFDDNMTIDSAAGKGSAQAALVAINRQAGVALSELKHFPAGNRRIALGNYVDLSMIAEDGTLSLDVNDGFKHNLTDYIAARFAERRCAPGHASKIRGCQGWASSRE